MVDDTDASGLRAGVTVSVATLIIGGVESLTPRVGEGRIGVLASALDVEAVDACGEGEGMVAVVVIDVVTLDDGGGCVDDDTGAVLTAGRWLDTARAATALL